MKLFGALLIIACSGWFGFSLAAAHRREEKSLRQLISTLDYMQCEMQYHLTPLPELCLQTANSCSKGPVRDFYLLLAEELRQQITVDVQPCVEAALDRAPKMTKITGECLGEIGKNLGKFDFDGQISSFEASRAFCRQRLEEHCAGKDEQRRSYQTLGICAGAALVIILI